MNFGEDILQLPLDWPRQLLRSCDTKAVEARAYKSGWKAKEDIKSFPVVTSIRTDEMGEVFWKLLFGVTLMVATVMADFRKDMEGFRFGKNGFINSFR